MTTEAVYVATVNRLLGLSGIAETVETLAQCSPSLFVLIYESLFGSALPVHRKTNLTRDEKVHNVGVLIKNLEWTIGVQLTHLTPDAIVAGDTKAVTLLIQLLDELEAVFSEQQLRSRPTAPVPVFLDSSVISQWCDEVRQQQSADPAITKTAELVNRRVRSRRKKERLVAGKAEKCGAANKKHEEKSNQIKREKLLAELQQRGIAAATRQQSILARNLDKTCRTLARHSQQLMIEESCQQRQNLRVITKETESKLKGIASYYQDQQQMFVEKIQESIHDLHLQQKALKDTARKRQKELETQQMEQLQRAFDALLSQEERNFARSQCHPEKLVRSLYHNFMPIAG